MFYEVIPEGKVEALTYDFGDSLLAGQIVTVPIGRRVVPGLVIKKVAQPTFKTKSILKVLYSKPLPRHLLDAVRFVHEYYMVPSGTAVSLVLPRGVEKKRRKTEQMFGMTLGGACPNPFLSGRSGPLGQVLGPSRKGFRPPTHHLSEPSLIPSHIPLNTAQKNALEGIQKAIGATKLLHGVTGSGKTNIYLKMALNALQDNKSTVLLVPEIALTGQLVRVFEKVFASKVITIHSKQTEAERHLIFDKILTAKEPMIVIGPRSALFAPLLDLGLIIIDEEHESTYYQENSPKYSAIRVASFMAKSAGCSLLLGSATPTVEDYYLASRQDSVITLTEKAKTSAVKPSIEIVDFKNRDNFSKNKYFSNSLLGAIASNLELGRQTLVFHNRRGSAPLTICEECGEEILCPNCFLPLNLHADSYELVCHTCEYRIRVPASCPKCQAPGLIHKGFGTKLLETELKKLFPEARIKRFDADNKKGDSLEEQYDLVRDGDVDILVGTQMLAKGLDLPHLATIGVVRADAGLNLPDYMAEERTFQLLTQVIGRVGRGHIKETGVFIQTFQPEHPVIQYAINEDYLEFYKYILKKRKNAGFPPSKFILKLEITMKTEAIVLRKIQELARKLSLNDKLMVSPAQPAFHEHTNKGYTWQIIVRSRSRKVLLDICKEIDQSFKITLDPPGLL